MLSFAAVAAADEYCDALEYAHMEFVEYCGYRFNDTYDFNISRDQYCRSRKMIDELNEKSDKAFF